MVFIWCFANKSMYYIIKCTVYRCGKETCMFSLAFLRTHNWHAVTAHTAAMAAMIKWDFIGGEDFHVYLYPKRHIWYSILTNFDTVFKPL